MKAESLSAPKRSGATFDAEHFEQDAPGSNPSLERLFCDSRVATYFRLEAGVARRCLSAEIEFILSNVGPAGNPASKRIVIQIRGTTTVRAKL